MSEHRSTGSGGPQEGTPEYDWLYGTDTAKGRTAPGADPDATRVVPQVPRQSAARPQQTPDQTQVMPVTPAAPSPRPARTAPPPPPVQKSRRGFFRPRRPRFRLRYLLILVVLWLAYLVFVPVHAWNSVSKVDNGFPTGSRPSDQPGTNYLVIGSDKADDLSAQQRKDLKTGPRGGTNTDTIIVLHVGSGLTTMMSIPRDTLTDVPGHGNEMINAAFSQGRYPLLIAAVEKLTGIHIDHFVELGFGSVINTVDAVGGITVCPTINMDDPLARLHIKKGCQNVNGETALAYSRSRHVTSLSDLDRVARQREVISAIGDKVVSPWTVINPVRYWDFNTAAANSIRVDKQMGIFDALRFARAMAGKHQTCTMPNLPAPTDPNRVVEDTSRAKALFQAIIKDSSIPASACTPTGRQKP